MVGGWLIEKGSSSGANPKSLRVHRTRYTACTQHQTPAQYKSCLLAHLGCGCAWSCKPPQAHSDRVVAISCCARYKLKPNSLQGCNKAVTLKVTLLLLHQMADLYLPQKLIC